MKTKYKIICFYSLIFLAWVIFSSRSDNPPDGRTNAPFDSFCTGCHSPSGAINGTVDISGLPSVVMGGETYEVTVTVTVSQGSPVRAGFQMVSVFTPGNTNAGDFTNFPSGVGSNTAGGREYVEHRGPRNFNGGQASWTFDWIAPDGPDGATITMYYAGNITNGNNQSSGDRPVSGNTSFTLSAASAPLVASITSQNNVTCNGLSDGSATASGSGGTPPFTFAWSNGAVTATASNLSAGNYTVTISDNNSMAATANVSITQPSALNTSVSGVNLDCNGDNSGSATANPTGGTTPYRYSWSNGLTSKTIGNLSAGNYLVTITDNNDCVTTGNVTITQPNPLQINVTSTDETAPMADDGTASVTASGGTSPYGYEWSNGATTMNLNNLAPGTYQVTVTDANDCAQVGMIAVQGLSCNLMATVDEEAVECFGQNTGAATVTVTGAQNPISYEWSNGLTTAMATNLAAGMYDVTVEDDNGCTTILPVTISQPDEIQINLATNDASCHDVNDGDILTMINGGVAPYDYLWSDNSTTTDLTGVLPGNYQLTITDVNDCTQTASVDLTANDILPPVIVTQDGTLYLDSAGVALIPLDLPFVESTDNCGIDSLWTDQTIISCDHEGQLEVLYFARDVAGNVTEMNSTITVLDTMTPYFMDCPEDMEVDSGTIVNYEIPQAFDNCEIDTFKLAEGLPGGSIFPTGETKVSYMAIDRAGNIGCCSFFVTVRGVTTGIDEQFSRKIKLFPNPANESIKINSSVAETTPVDVFIFSSAGQQLKDFRNLSLTSEILELGISDLSKGIYFVRIIQQEKIAIRKIIKD